MFLRHFFRFAPLIITLTAAFGLLSGACSAADFNASFLLRTAANADWIASDRQIAPGVYSFDVYINGTWRGKYELQITRESRLKIRQSDVALLEITDTDKTLANAPAGAWLTLDLLTHGGKSALNSGQLRVDLTIPQAYITQTDSRWLPPPCAMGRGRKRDPYHLYGKLLSRLA